MTFSATWAAAYGCCVEAMVLVTQLELTMDMEEGREGDWAGHSQISELAPGVRPEHRARRVVGRVVGLRRGVAHTHTLTPTQRDSSRSNGDELCQEQLHSRSRDNNGSG